MVEFAKALHTSTTATLFQRWYGTPCNGDRSPRIVDHAWAIISVTGALRSPSLVFFQFASSYLVASFGSFLISIAFV